MRTRRLGLIRHLGVTVVAALLPWGCGGEEAPAAGVQAGSPDPLQPLFELVADAIWNTRYSGVRRVEVHVPISGEIRDLAYTEEVFSDGEGRFAIDPLDVLTYSHPSAAESLSRLKLREGFFYRYRDFRVRDLGRFYENYDVIELDPAIVAGRACTEFLILRRQGGDRSYTVAIDEQTGLILRYRQRDVSGTLLSAMQFETFDADPDLSGVAWYQSSGQEVSLDVFQDLDDQAGFDVLVPRVVPQGFSLWRVQVLIDPDHRTWAKMVFTDGVDTLFFLHAAEKASIGLGAPGLPLGASSEDGLASHAHDDVLMVYGLGEAIAIQGEVRGYPVIAVGTAAEQEVLDLIESALP